MGFEIRRDPQPFLLAASLPPLLAVHDKPVSPTSGTQPPSPDESTENGSNQPHPRAVPVCLFENTPMNPKPWTPILGLTLAATLLGGCSKPKESFGPQPLTKDDIISLYHVPVDQQPFQKFVWVFDHEQYIRFVVERAAAGSNRWEMVYSIPYHLPLTRAVVIYRLENVAIQGSPARLWTLDLWLGGSDGLRSGRSDSQLAISEPYDQWMMTAHPDDPARLCLIQLKDCRVRFRVEKADTPFALKFGPWPVRGDR